MLASTPTELQKQLRLAINSREPTVIEVPVGEFPLTLGIHFDAKSSRLTGRSLQGRNSLKITLCVNPCAIPDYPYNASS